MPFVVEYHCSGCGFCEHHCPVEARPAIVVEPMEALRLSTGSYRQEGRAIGLRLRLSTQKKVAGGDETVYPADDGRNGSGLPPGFSE